MKNSHFYSNTFGAGTFCLLKDPEKTGFTTKDFYNYIIKIADRKELTFLNEEQLEKLMEQDVVLAACSTKATLEELFCGIAFLQLAVNKEPYNGFCADFDLKLNQCNRIIYAACEDDDLFEDMLWRLEQNIKFAGAKSSFSIIEKNNIAMQNRFVKAGYQLKFADNMVVAVKDISKSELINFYLVDCDDFVPVDYLSLMKCYSRKVSSEVEQVRFTEAEKLHNLMQQGYLVGAIKNGAYQCYQYAELCKNLKAQTVVAKATVAA